jgi:hypothetical protein
MRPEDAIFITPCKPKAQLGVSRGAQRPAAMGWGGARENPRGEQAVKKAKVIFRAE